MKARTHYTFIIKANFGYINGVMLQVFLKEYPEYGHGPPEH